MATPPDRSKSFAVPSEAIAQKPKDPPQRDWIGRILATREGLEGEKIDRIAVSAGPKRSKMSRIVVLRLRSETTIEGLIEDIDAAVRTSGERHAKIEAYRAGDKTPEFTRAWEIPCSDDDPDNADDFEVDPARDSVAAASAGLLRQAYNHNETYLKAFQGLVGETLQHHRETTQDLRLEVRALRAENASLSKALSTREDERAARQIQINRESAIAGAFQNLVTAVSVRLSGQGETIPEHLADLLNSLSDKQQEAVMSLLRPDQQPLLASILRTVEERREAAKKGEGK